MIGAEPSPPEAADYPDEVGFVGFMVGACGLPMRNVSQAHAGKEFPSVLPDNVATGRCAAEHLLRRGYKNIVFAAHGDLAYSRLRGAGIRAAALARESTMATYLGKRTRRAPRPD